jgi:hypothetical protein
MKVLNVGGNSKSIPLPKIYDGWEHHLLDIDPVGKPDICCDAVELKNKTEYFNTYDSVYCSHNLEHFYRHKVKDVLIGFYKVLKEDGFIRIHVPHILNVMRRVICYNMDLSDTLYEVSAGPITAHDVMYGWGKQIESSGVDFFAHKCAFTPKMLGNAITQAGFSNAYVKENDLELSGFGFKIKPSEELLNRVST